MTLPVMVIFYTMVTAAKIERRLEMKSILEEISKLRKGAPLVIDYKNSNRYRIVAIESNGSKTAYYFTSPIYNIRTRKAIDMKFFSNRETIYSVGTNANITISETIRMENAEGSCIISLPRHTKQVSAYEASCGSERLFPTTNGVAMKSDCQNGRSCSFTIEISKPFLEVRANDKYFALMSERFRPFFVVSCIGAIDAYDNIISPAKLIYQKITDRKYTITVSSGSSLGKFVLIEANLYEPKLFQDTTVESKNPQMNNAFGSVGFIGTTKEFGEQWLYTRPDFSKLNELNDKKILRAILHLPRLNSSTVELTASKVSARFCSFGSTWDNKIAAGSSPADSQTTDHYIDLNMTPILADKNGRLTLGEGFILKAKKKDCGFAVIATGDNYFAPQILEINYR